jgi:ornithine cyclodeaminase/alanine dehydrogenase-like protein (mu-crystallin family)
MAKQGMKRPEVTHIKSENKASAVPEIQGKAKHGNVHANPIIAGTQAPALKVYHSIPHNNAKKEKPVSEVYPVIDNDIARDNIENDMTAADLQDL